MVLTFSDSMKKWMNIVELTPRQLDERDAEYRALIPGIVADETQRVRELIASGATYVVNGERNLVHDVECSTIRHQVDRERAWREQTDQLLAMTRHTIGGPFHHSIPMPNLLTRNEVERLTRYSVCQVCSPDTDTRKKAKTQTDRSTVKVGNLARDHIGRALIYSDGAESVLREISTTITADATTYVVRTDESTMVFDDGNDIVTLRRRPWLTSLGSELVTGDTPDESGNDNPVVRALD